MALRRRLLLLIDKHNIAASGVRAGSVHRMRLSQQQHLMAGRQICADLLRAIGDNTAAATAAAHGAQCTHLTVRQTHHVDHIVVVVVDRAVAAHLDDGVRRLQRWWRRQRNVFAHQTTTMRPVCHRSVHAQLRDGATLAGHRRHRHRMLCLAERAAVGRQRTQRRVQRELLASAVVVIVGGAAVMMAIGAVMVAIVVAVTVLVVLRVERVVQRELAAEHKLEGARHFDVDGRRNGDQRRGGLFVLAVLRVAAMNGM